MARDDLLLFRWREAFCSPAGPPAITRLVLWTLVKHMGMDGSDCYPGQELIASESGLSIRSVKQHLEAAEKSGWIMRTPRHRGNRTSWRYGTDYQPRFPCPSLIGASSAPIAEGKNGANGAPMADTPNGADHVNIGAADTDMVHQPHTSTSENASEEHDAFKNNCTQVRMGGRTFEQFVSTMEDS